MAPDYVALIPARGGSQGIPRKNLEVVGKLSLLRRAIESAVNVEKLRGCYVSSDDPEILKDAEAAGAIPLKRGKDAASNAARANSVVDDFLLHHPQLDEGVFIVYLQPTSPFRSSHNVEDAIEALEVGSGEALVSVVNSHQLPEKTLRISPEGLLQPASESVDPGKNRQEIPRGVYPNGAIYIFSVGAFRRLGDIPVVGAIPFLMGKVESLDIDDAEDLALARGVAEHAGI